MGDCRLCNPGSGGILVYRRAAGACRLALDGMASPWRNHAGLCSFPVPVSVPGSCENTKKSDFFCIVPGSYLGVRNIYSLCSISLLVSVSAGHGCVP